MEIPRIYHQQISGRISNHGNFGDFENGQELVLSTLEAKAAAPCKALKRWVNIITWTGKLKAGNTQSHGGFFGWKMTFPFLKGVDFQVNHVSFQGCTSLWDTIDMNMYKQKGCRIKH